MRILFVCKKNEMYSQQIYTRRSCGLFNSTSFIVRGLAALGVHAHIVEVEDNNAIDREVAAFRPNVVIIEALWVVPEKFKELQKLHPKIEWFIHLHSHMPFLALEGISMSWILDCAELGVGIIANSKPSYDALAAILYDDELAFLPNVYISDPYHVKPYHDSREVVAVGCFGALRPLKNHLLQALAAIQFAKEIGKPLEFWINTGRVETGGEPVLKCIRQLFERIPDAKLVEAKWNEPNIFINTLHNKVDIGLQVSLTETFNVVTADYVSAGIPVVVSKEVAWVSDFCKAQDDSIHDIVRVMHRVYKSSMLIRWNQYLLKRHERKAIGLWYDWLHSLSCF